MSNKLFAILAALSVIVGGACLAEPHTHRHVRHSAHRQVHQSVKVWVNTNSGVYHYPGERWYGRTKEGEYMTEDEARGRGYRPTMNGQ